MTSLFSEPVREASGEHVFWIQRNQASDETRDSWIPRASVLEFVAGDITAENTDAIVNPASGGLVDLAVRRLAGPSLAEAFRAAVHRLPGRQFLPGQAIVTPGFGLGVAHVVHCSPPITYTDDPKEAQRELASCHVESLRLARVRGFSSIGFPAIGTGIRGYPVAEAAVVAVRAVVQELRAFSAPALVRFILFGPAMRDVYLEAARSELKGLEQRVR